MAEITAWFFRNINSFSSIKHYWLFFSVDRCEHTADQTWLLSISSHKIDDKINTLNEMSFIVLWCHLSILIDELSLCSSKIVEREKPVYDWLRYWWNCIDLFFQLFLWSSTDIRFKQRSIFHLLSTVLSFVSNRRKSIKLSVSVHTHGYRLLDVSSQALLSKWSECKSD